MWEALQHLRSSENPQTRALFVDVVGQLDAPRWPLREESVRALLDMLANEIDAAPLCALGIAFGHLNEARAIEPLARLKEHPDANVRYGVVCGMSGHANALAVETLIALSSDADRNVRDWATFGLASQIDLDTLAIRAALLDRVDDDDPEIRGEALIGLARRHDLRVLEPLRRALAREFYGIWAIEAAEYLADPALYPLLQACWARLTPEEQQQAGFERQYQDALAACAPGQ